MEECPLSCVEAYLTLRRRREVCVDAEGVDVEIFVELVRQDPLHA